MPQQEKAKQVLDNLFNNSRYYRVGLSEKFLRNYAHKKWVTPDERLSGDVIIREANIRVLFGQYITYMRGQMRFYAPNKRGLGVPFCRSSQM